MKSDVDLRHLRVFLAVVESGAHARAAHRLGISPSTISETLSALERALGTPVFRKTGKTSMLTPAGEALVPYAQRMLALSSDLVTSLAKVTTDVSATLVIAAVESLSAYVLPAPLAALRRRWPKARLEVTAGTCGEIRESVAAGQCDVGLILEADTGRDDASILARTRLVVFGAPGHPFANRAPAPHELGHCEFYMSDAGGDYHQVLRLYFESDDTPLPRMQALGTVEGVKRGILTGASALGLLPIHAVEQELRDGVLTEVRAKPPLRALAMRALVAPGRATSPIVDDLLDHLRGVASHR
jgi:DNA-binding transcriptional LysR family regulator